MSSVDEQPDIAAKVEFLRRAENYADRTASVEAIQTHRSWVFLTDRYAYKLKKPIRSSMFDFGTLEARRQNCHHEVRLNRRLAGNVYLGVVALSVDTQGRLAIGGDGKPVEWLVQMRKLPRDRMLDRCLVRSVVTPQEIEAVGGLLSRFYRRAPAAPWSGSSYCRHLAESISAARSGLLTPSFGLPRDQIVAIARGLAALLVVHRAELIQRVRSGRVIDAHGDLRPEHICLESPPVVIDCLEFNPNLRILDTASELSFLTQECELLTGELRGAADVSQSLWRVYVQQTDDPVSAALRRFYCGYHAFLRASLAIAHLADNDVPQPERWKRQTQRYLDAATKASPSSTRPS